MKEMVVISGKGGTGKTSIVASLAALSGKAVLADCDVDAADLHLVLSPTIMRREDFRCGHEAVIRQADCMGCGACLARCRFGAVLHITGAKHDLATGANVRGDNSADGLQRSHPGKEAGVIAAIRATSGQEKDHAFAIDPTACEGCGVCVWSCPVNAIDFPERLSGAWYVSETRHGPMVHARLIPGGENSGKLVSKVREAARALATEQNSDLILVDGPPGVGCAVIASITGASEVLIVTEPTLSGAHDMARVLELTRHFNISTSLCVNKWDLNEEITERIESEARRAGAVIAGRIRYDRAVTEAQLQGKAVVELYDTAAGKDIRAVWDIWKAGRGERRAAENTTKEGKRTTMKIAIPVVNGKLCTHFGHCEQFALLDVDEPTKTVTGKRMLTPPPHEPGVLPRWLHEEGANLIIAGGMGERAQAIFTRNSIKVVVGAAAHDPEDLASRYLAGTLASGTNRCDH